MDAHQFPMRPDSQHRESRSQAPLRAFKWMSLHGCRYSALPSQDDPQVDFN